MPHLIRFLAEAKAPLRNITDAVTGQRIFWWRGSDITLELALTQNGQHLLAADIGTLIVEVKTLLASPSDAALMRKEYGSADCDPTFTAASWANGSKALLTADFTDAEAALPPGHYRIIIRHEDPAGLKNTFASSEIEVIEDHSESSSLSAPPSPGAEYWNKTEADSRFAPAALSGEVDTLEATVTGIINTAPNVAQLENPHGLLPFIAAAQNFDTDSTEHEEPYFLSVLRFGDSMASPYAQPIVEELEKQWGVGAWTVGALGGIAQNAAAGDFTFTGGATRPASFTNTPGQNWVNMPSGSTAAHTLNRTTEVTTKASSTVENAKTNNAIAYRPLPGGCAKVAVLIATAPSAGTLEITVSQDQYTDLTATVDTDDAAGFIAQEFTPADRHAPITVLIENTLATSTLIGIIYFSADGGIFGWDAATGSSSMEQMLASLDAGSFKPAFQGLFNYLNTRLVVHHQRAANDTNALANYPTFFDAFAEIPASGSVTQLIIGELPLQTEGAITIATHNAALRALAKTRGFPFIDGSKILGSYAALAAVGWQGDGVHFYHLAPRLIAATILHATAHLLTTQSLHRATTSPFHRIRQRHQLEMIEEAVTDRIQIRTGYVITEVNSGSGYDSTVDNMRGLVITGGAAIGHAKATIGSIGWSESLPTANKDFSISINGYRSISLVANQRAALIFGLRDNNSFTALSAIANRCFGVEFALGDDVGTPDGATGANRHAARLFVHDGTAMIYGRWFGLGIPGDSVTSNNGHAIVLDWNLARQTLTLSAAVPDGSVLSRALRPMSSITSSGLAAGVTHGGYAFGLVNATTAPATTGFISLKNITFRGGNIAHPHRGAV
jgi:hypothetical protein